MRLAGIEKGGFYPYPLTLAEATASFLTPTPAGTRGRLLDPCAGEGEIATRMGALLNCETWGAELFSARAEKAAARLDKCYAAAWQACALTDESVTVLWLNPPYDDDRHGEDKRLEFSFLKATTPKLVRGGVLIFVVPQRLLGMPEVAKFLTGHYERLIVRRFPGGEYARFKQITLFGVRRQTYHAPGREEVDRVRALAGSALSPLDPVKVPSYEVLPTPTRGAGGRAITFRRLDFAPQDLVEASRTHGVRTGRVWADLLQPPVQEAAFRPAMPLKKGHLAMLMASGMMGTLRLATDTGPMLVKGRVVKHLETLTEPDPHDPEIVVDRYRDRYVTTLATLQAGGVEVIQDEKRLGAFMKTHGETLAAQTLQAYQPLYGLKPTAQELAVLEPLGKTRKPLPGQAAPGLLPVQKHAAIALARALRTHGAANAQGEMGVGKTTVGLAVTELLDAYPALVLCPPHLVPKWMREAEEVIPGLQARELRRIGKDGEGEVNDVRAFLDAYAAGKLGHKALAVVASTAAKMGPGWTPVVRAKTVKVDEVRQLRYVCPQCGQEQVDERGDPVTEVEFFQKHRRFCSATVKGWQVDAQGAREKDEQGQPVWGTRSCRAPLFVCTNARRQSIAEYLLHHARGRFNLLVADDSHQYKAKASDRGVAFHQLAEACRRTLTLTGTLFGGKSTSLFWLLHRLNPHVRQDFAFHDEMRWAARYGVLESTRKRKVGDQTDDDDGAFTGHRRYRGDVHELPGVSPAIVARLLPNTVFLNLKDLGVDLPPYTEEVVELPLAAGQDDDYRRMESDLRALAKQQPRFLAVWLQWALARPNSGFRDETVVLHLKTPRANELLALAQNLLEQADEPSTSLRALAEKLRAAAQFAETAAHTRLKAGTLDLPLIELPAVTGDTLLPKERWLVDFCQAERGHGRRVLVYVRQTGTRDIQVRLEAILRQAGLRAVTLYGSVNPHQREAWIARHSHAEVLLVNPKLVETGLDLVQFATVVFFEIEYSLYTLWQALRRVWRLGQTKPVKAVFVVYQNTLEAQALALMGRKMRAAQLLFGDEVGGALVPVEDGDFLSELAREVLRGSRLDDLQHLFAEEAGGESEEPEQMVIEAAPAPPDREIPVPLKDWALWVRDLPKPAGRPGARKAVPVGQLGLWG